MYWRGQILTTYGDIMKELIAAPDKETAIELAVLYRSHCPEYWRSNINYLLLGWPDEDRARIQGWLREIKDETEYDTI